MARLTREQVSARTAKLREFRDLTRETTRSNDVYVEEYIDVGEYIEALDLMAVPYIKENFPLQGRAKHIFTELATEMNITNTKYCEFGNALLTRGW